MRHSATEYEPLTLPGCEDLATADASARRAVHPAAAIFPLMSDTELNELAADIKANGQVHPIVRDAQGQLIDGRNRLAACELAGVEPRFSTLPPDVDPVAFILSCNVQRRQMSKGQRAMAIALAHACLKQDRGEQAALATELELSEASISRAFSVLRYAPELAASVMSGATSLTDAYALAREAKAKAEGRNLAAERAAADLRRLQAEAADLADHVIEERLTLADALAALTARLDEATRKRRVATTAYAAVVRTLLPGDWTPAERADLIARDLDNDFADDLALDGIEARACAATLLAIAAQLGGEGDNDQWLSANAADAADEATAHPATDGQFEWPEEETESAAEKAFYALSRQRLIGRYTPAQIADAVSHPADDLPGFEEFRDWITAFVGELQTRTRIRLA